MGPKRYRLKDAYLTNLDTFITKCHCILYGFEDNEYDEYDGKDYDYWESRLIEAQRLLESTMGDRSANWKDYVRIREISDERNIMRYETCISKGMSEEDASYAFLD